MKKILLLALVISMTNCKIESKKDNIVDANYQVEKDIEMYINLWDAFIYNRDTSVINSQYFTEDCIVVTQGNKLIKHYNFKGKHTGDFFGIPASGNYLDLSATTIVTMRDGRIAKEHDFYNMQAILDQLMKSKGDIVIDEQKSIN